MPKLKMNQRVENYPLGMELPSLIPNQPTFGKALKTIEISLRALIETIEPINFKETPLPAVKEVIQSFLGQMDYLLRFSKINGVPIGQAKLEHPLNRIEKRPGACNT